MNLKRPVLLVAYLTVMPLLAWGQTLNLYTWADYIPESVIHQFENKTGIHVNVGEFDSNAMLYTKLKSMPHGYYDVVFPSSNFVERMIQEKMLKPLNHDQLPNLKHLKKQFKHAPYDPGNRYSVPYLWGTTGIVVNDRYHDPAQINSWADLWAPRYHHQVLVLDEMTEVFAMALAKLGYPINTTSNQQIQQAFSVLKGLRPNIKLFKGDGAYLIYIAEDATIGMIWSGSAYLARQHNPHLHYIYPKEAFPLWVDCMVIPENAPHPKAAERFINFIQRPDIARFISQDQGFSSPNQQAMDQLPRSMKNNRIINPSDKTLKRAVIQRYVGSRQQQFGDYWERLKLGL